MKRTLFITTIIIVAAIVVGVGAFVLRDKNFYPDKSQQPQAGDSYTGCIADTDCVLVQEKWCKTVLAVNKTKEAAWQEDNAKQTEIARQNAQTCELMPEGYFVVENFRATCKQSECVAEFIGD